ncbi:MAG TPA: hypothetical protein VM118_13285, partial [Acidobacteriota bacterium]|nr:hypothetical protein [Acidobacteriota bacterium]
MRRLYTWGMVFWAIAWLFAPPNPNAAWDTYWWLAGIGTALILLAAWSGEAPAARWRSRALAPVIALAALGWWWFDPRLVAPLVLAAGGLLMVIAGGSRIGARIGNALIVAGTVAFSQLIGYYLFLVYFGPRAHGAAIPTGILAGALRLFGVNAASMADGLHLMSVDRLYQVVPSPANMGLYVFLMMFMGVLALALTGKIRVRAIVSGAFVIGLFALVRYAIVMLWDYNNDIMPKTYWDPVIFAWTVWPVAFFLQRATVRIPTRPARRPLPGNPVHRRLGIAILATILGIFFWTAYEGYHPAGVMKPGRMLIDELHSDWEWSEMPFDTLWYGQQSTYNFYCLAEYWGKYYQMHRGFDSLTPELLDNYDILVLKVPTQPYAPEEIEAVYDWVSDGGGLILIGEHTNVFGYATFLNPVANRFGQRFIPDIVYELQTGDLNLERMPDLLPHPVANNMPEYFLFGGPCSMYGDLSARSIITGLELKTLPADYTQRNFFPERTGHAGYRFGIFLLSMSTRCGKGRIVSFTDSTLWSNFFVFVPGKPELALELANYVNRYDPFPFCYWRIVAFWLGIAGFLVAGVAAAGLQLEGWLWVAAVGCLTFAGSAHLFEAVNAKNYPRIEFAPHTPFPQLNFEDEHSRFFIPELRLAREPDKDFATFFLWTQRVGVVPRKFNTLEDALAQPGGQIIIDPVVAFDSTETALMREFVTNGGTLYVLDDPTNRASTSNQLLVHFGMRFDMTPIPLAATREVGNVLWQHGGKVIGGEPLLSAPDGSVSCALAPFGDGQVIAFANSHIFE